MVKETYRVRVRKNNTSTFSFEEEMLRRYSERLSCQFFGNMNTTGYKFGGVDVYVDNGTTARFFGDTDKIDKVRQRLEKKLESFKFDRVAA